MSVPSPNDTFPSQSPALSGSNAAPVANPHGTAPGAPQQTISSAEMSVAKILAAAGSVASPQTVSSSEMSIHAIKAAAASSHFQGRTVGRYQLLHELGSGGMGTVYKAFDPQIERTVALKVIRGLGPGQSQAMRQQFLHEARAVAKLEGADGIVSVLDHNFDQDAGELFFTMRVIDGGTLRRKMLPDARWPPADAVALVLRLARAIQQAHEVGVVHRDLKPENVLIDAAGHPWVTDFGIAWSTDAAAAEWRTDREAVAGTLNYMAPEQVRGIAAAISPRTDIYALGVILYELIAARLPFVPSSGDADPIATLERAIVLQVPFPASAYAPEVPSALDAVVLKCLAKEPVDRYASATALADDLERLLDGHPVAAESASVPLQIWQRCRRQAAYSSLAAGAAVQFLAGVGWGVAAWLLAGLVLRQPRVLPTRNALTPAKASVGAAIGVVAAVVVWGVSCSPVLQDFERRMQDTQFHDRGPRVTHAPITILALDRASLDELTEPLVFLSPKLAEVMRYLSEQGATAIGLDFLIPSAAAGGPWLQPGQPGDAEELGRAVGETGRVVLPVLYDAPQGVPGGGRTEPLPQWLAKHFLMPEWNDLGVVNLTADRDQILRRQSLWTNDVTGSVPHFSLAILGRHRHWDDRRPEAPSARGELQNLPSPVIVNYAGPAGTFPTVSFREALAAARGQLVDPAFNQRWRGQMVLIGTTDLSLGDRHLTPYSRRPPTPLWRASRPRGVDGTFEDEWMAGVELQANIVATIHDEAWISSLSHPAWPTAWMLPMGAILGGFASRRRLPQILSTIFLVQGLWWCLTGWLFQSAGIALPLCGTWLLCFAAPCAVLVWRSGKRSPRTTQRLAQGRST